MKILISGAAGFIGTHVRAELARVAPAAELFLVDNFEPRVHGESPDTSGFLRRSTGMVFPDEMEGVDVVIHLAAQVGVADSMTDPCRYVFSNTVDTTMFYEKLHAVRPKKVVVASSMSVYGDPHTSDPIGEAWGAAPASVYGLTKLDQEVLTLTLAPLFGAVPVALRFFNVYGPGQALTNPYTGVLANFAQAILSGGTPTVYEDGLQTRDFIYVGDVAQAVVEAALNPSMEGIYNVCTGRPQTILGVAEGMVDALGGGEAPNVTHTLRPGDIRHCIGRNTRLRTAMPGFAPMPFEEGLELYAEDLVPGGPGSTNLANSRAT